MRGGGSSRLNPRHKSAFSSLAPDERARVATECDARVECDSASYQLDKQQMEVAWLVLRQFVIVLCIVKGKTKYLSRNTAK